MNKELRDLIITNFIAIFLGILCSALCLLFLNLNPLSTFGAAIVRIFTDKYTMGDVFLKATPLIFTALAFAFTFKANLFNIGAQGQFYMGAVLAISLSLTFGSVLPAPLLLAVVLIGTIVGGGIIGAIIGFLKAKFNANEFLVSMMSTYVVLAFMNYLLRTFLKETKGEYPQTDPIAKSAWIPKMLKGTRMHYGFIIAVIVAVLVWILLYKTALGFRIRSVGNNSVASKLAGISPKKIYILAFFISGALAGIAGFTEVNGVQHMLIQDFNTGIGSAGIGIAILANANPIGIIFASLLFGMLNVVGNIMGRMPGVNVPASIVEIMQGFVMIYVIMAYFVRAYMKEKRDKKKIKEGAK